MEKKFFASLCILSLLFLSDVFKINRQTAESILGIKDTSVLDLFVMTHCPYTLRAEKEIIPFVKENSDRVDLRIHYIVERSEASVDGHPDFEKPPPSADISSSAGCSGIGGLSYRGFSSLHGEKEIDESMRQLLIREFYPGLYLDYLLARADRIDADWREVADRLGLDVDMIEELISDGTGEELLLENIRWDRELHVGASPTLFIDGERFTGRLDHVSLAAEIFGAPVGDSRFASGPGSALTGTGNFPSGEVGTANPASVYCRELGYEYMIVGDDEQVGICVLPDGENCEEWEFLEGKCGREYSYCLQNGYDMVTLSDGKDPFSREYAMCVSEEGDVIGTVTDLMSLSARATKASTFSPVSSAPPDDMMPTGAGAPSSIDWRDHDGYNWVTPVKNQGGCGSCWAFGSVAAVEAVVQIKSGDPFMNLNLSEEYLVSDCHGNVLSQNCCGGMHFRALQFIRNQGIPDESCMPYVDGYGCSCGGGSCDSNCQYRYDGACSDRTCSDRCSDWQDRLIRIDSTGPVTDIQEAIASMGPVSASFGIGSAFGGYWDGDIYRCTNDNGVNHVIALVGYDDAGGYWIGKNSWGSGWGDGGFFKIGYGECSIEGDVRYANNMTCGDTITTSLTLYNDLSGCGGNALIIGADNITLNCNGSSVTGLGVGAGIVLQNRQNVFVKNCVVSGFETGIEMTASTYNTLVKNTLTENTLYGIHLDDSQENTIWKNDFVDNPVNAYEEAGSNGNYWFDDREGNDWSDFDVNPGYPNSYIIDGPGDGIDPWPNGRVHKIYRSADGP